VLLLPNLMRADRWTEFGLAVLQKASRISPNLSTRAPETPLARPSAGRALAPERIAVFGGHVINRIITCIAGHKPEPARTGKMPVEVSPKGNNHI
jgi:hypothetical protein